MTENQDDLMQEELDQKEQSAGEEERNPAADQEEVRTPEETGQESGEPSPEAPGEDPARETEGAGAEEPDMADPQDAQEDPAGEPEGGTEDDVMDGEWQEAGSGIKGFFRKKDKKDKREQQIEELTDRVRRQMAEFDNFRKRTEKEKTAMYEIGAKSVIEKILPVVDSFERGLTAGADEQDPFVEGMQKIYKQLMTTLETMEVKPIEAVGQEFNPDLHNAVMHVDDESVGENIIVEELQKGYTYRDSVVRYSMVKVAN